MFGAYEFDWDAGNSGKCLKHGVSQVEIEALFEGAPLVAPDIRHSGAERRLIAIGRGCDDRPLFVVFTFRSRGDVQLIRPLSARYMHAKELKRYAETGS